MAVIIYVVKLQNGQWNWISNSIASCFGETDNVREWLMTSVNRTGYNSRDFLYYSPSWDAIWNIDGKGCSGYVYGEGSNGSFNLDYNNVFSPYSNPYTHTWNNSLVNFTMEIDSQNNSDLFVNFYLTNPLAGKPSKPQKLELTIVNYHPHLTWSHNIEPDLAGHNIYRTENSINEEQIAFVADWRSGYTDTEVSTNIQSDVISYTIKAKDTSSLLSINSDPVSIIAILQKPSPVTELKISQTNYSLAQNYPNPFNPSTEISYTLKEDGIVVIKVFDVLGKEVAILKNKFETAGNHIVNFNAANLPSGIYFYRITAGSFFNTRKMLLIK